MATINVSSSQNIRDAISGGGSFSVPASGDTISIAVGSFDITSTVIPNVPGPGATGPATFSYAAKPNINSVTGFIGPTNLIFSGAGNFGDLNVTTITGNPRLYVGNSDGYPPTSLDFRDLDLNYTGGLGYILQTGQFNNTPAITSSINLDNLSFRGTHAGAGGPGNPNGNYGALLNFNSLTLKESTVSLTGQSNFIPTASVSNGSSFLMLKGNSMSITGNRFDESGYRNALSIFGSTNVTLTGNTFFRSNSASRFARYDLPFSSTPPGPTPKGNKISNSTGVSVSGNTFANGSLLALEGGSGTVSSNTFTSFTASDPTDMAANSGLPVGILLEGTPNYSYTSNTFQFVTPFANKTGTIQQFATNGTADNVLINPFTNSSANVTQFVTGTDASETLTGTAGVVGTPRRDFIAGGFGNDTLDGGNGVVGNPDADFYLFNTTPNSTTNIDTIINYTVSTAVAQRDQIWLDRKIFTGLTTTSTQPLVPVGLTGLGGIGGIANGNAQLGTTSSGAAANASQRIILASGAGADQGKLFWDPDGTGSAPGVAFARIRLPDGTFATNISQIGNIYVI